MIYLLTRHEKEKRELQIRFASEKNALERSFAEEKVAMMSRLQVRTDKCHCHQSYYIIYRKN
jgi:hypothetical protein